MVAIKNDRRLNALLILAILCVLAWAFYRFPVWSGPVMSASVSESGRYAVTANRENMLILWDLEKQEWRKISGNANIYSATFVPGKDVFLWQDLENEVRVQSVDGEQLQAFDHFPTYGHRMTEDLETYISVDQEWNVFRGFGEELEPILQDGVSPSFLGTGKLLNLALSDERSLFVTAGFDDDSSEIEDYPPVDNERRFSQYSGVTLWSLETGKPLAKLRGNSAKAHATISPDGQWVVSGDENGIGLYWNTERLNERHRLARYHSGIFIDDTPHEMGDPRNRDTSGLIDAPPGTNNTTIAQAFIHQSEYYLRFGNNSHIAALFKAGSQWPVKYFDLGDSPELVTHGSQYSRNTAIATSPAAGILVTGHRTGGGISVYQFDADKLTLERVWVVE